MIVRDKIISPRSSSYIQLNRPLPRFNVSSPRFIPYLKSSSSTPTSSFISTRSFSLTSNKNDDVDDRRRTNASLTYIEQADKLSSNLIESSLHSSPESTSFPTSTPTPTSTTTTTTTLTTTTTTTEEEEEKAISSSSSFIQAQADLEESLEKERQIERKRTEAKLQNRPSHDSSSSSSITAWDGEETRERMIQRILEDSYKPLRIKGFKKSIPGAPTVVHPSIFTLDESKLIPTRTSPQPINKDETPKNSWDYSFKGPKTIGTSHSNPDDRSPRSNLLIRRSGPTKPIRKIGERLSLVKEKTLDYHFGVGLSTSDRKNGKTNQEDRLKIMVPVQEQDLSRDHHHHLGDRSVEETQGEMRIWEGFIEDKVNQAIANGLFKNLRGRGRPLNFDESSSNPFLPREDRLINRVVKNQGAMPPWVEMQQQLESNLSSFRNELRQSYTRRMTRILSLPENLSRTTINSVLEGEYTDVEWEERERAFHQTSIDSLNQLTRRLNIVAPYSARRAWFKLERELSNCKKRCNPFIAEELLKRIQGKSQHVFISKDGQVINRSQLDEQGEEIAVEKQRFWPALRRGVWELFGIGQTAQKSKVEEKKNDD